MINKGYWQNGQIGLVVLLILVVMTTVGVSVATRSVSELRLSRQEQESTKALNAAEAGIEEALTQDLATLVGSTSCAPCTSSVDGIPVSYTVEQSTTITDQPVAAGHTMDVNLVGATATDMIISWSETGAQSSDAAIVVALISPSGVTRYAFDQWNPRRADNNFSAPTGTGNSTSVNIGGYDQARIKVLYAGTQVTVNGSGLPVQSYIVKSNASLEDGTTRAVQVTQRVGSLPSIFDYALFSGDTIIK